MKTKYPIILVHGVMIKELKFLHAFGRIEKILKSNGYIVATATTDGIGSIKTNAVQLKEYINKILTKYNVDKVNLIAHSKGGLDAKYMIEKLDMSNHVASLITLCTPFKGSPVASSILDLPRPIIWIAKTWFNVVYKIFGDKHPNSLQVCKELSTSDNLITECMNIKDIYVESYSTTLKKSKDNFIMGIPHAFCKYICESPVSDGLVEPKSTEFDNFQGDAIKDASISHTDIIDFFPNKRKKDRIYSFYLSLAGKLLDLGL